MEKLILNDDLLIAKGGERACYLHPQDSAKVIKVIFADQGHNRQNELEHTYFEYLHSKKVPLDHITECFGYVDTNLGKGLVFERVINQDGSKSHSLRYMMANKLISENEQLQLINELWNYLKKNNILFIDTSLTNIFCKEDAAGKNSLIIVDGLGAKRMGFKFWLYRHCSLYARYKMSRQWQKFMKMYRADIQRIHEGKRPITRF